MAYIYIYMTSIRALFSHLVQSKLCAIRGYVDQTHVAKHATNWEVK